jgi:hypothetical protein
VRLPTTYTSHAGSLPSSSPFMYSSWTYEMYLGYPGRWRTSNDLGSSLEPEEDVGSESEDIQSPASPQKHSQCYFDDGNVTLFEIHIRYILISFNIAARSTVLHCTKSTGISSKDTRCPFRQCSLSRTTRRATHLSSRLSGQKLSIYLFRYFIPCEFIVFGVYCYLIIKHYTLVAAVC